MRTGTWLLGRRLSVLSADDPYPPPLRRRLPPSSLLGRRLRILRRTLAMVRRRLVRRRRMLRHSHAPPAHSHSHADAARSHHATRVPRGSSCGRRSGTRAPTPPTVRKRDHAQSFCAKGSATRLVTCSVTAIESSWRIHEPSASQTKKVCGTCWATSKTAMRSGTSSSPWIEPSFPTPTFFLRAKSLSLRCRSRASSVDAPPP